MTNQAHPLVKIEDPENGAIIYDKRNIYGITFHYRQSVIEIHTKSGDSLRLVFSCKDTLQEAVDVLFEDWIKDFT